MSVIKHLQTDVWDGDKFNARYEIYPRDLNNVWVGHEVGEFHIRLDNDVDGMVWIFNKINPRCFLFMKRQVVINMYNPFIKGYRIKV